MQTWGGTRTPVFRVDRGVLITNMGEIHSSNTANRTMILPLPAAYTAAAARNASGAIYRPGRSTDRGDRPTGPHSAHQSRQPRIGRLQPTHRNAPNYVFFSQKILKVAKLSIDLTHRERPQTSQQSFCKVEFRPVNRGGSQPKQLGKWTEVVKYPL